MARFESSSSSYGAADYTALTSELIQAGTAVAQTAINKSGQKRGSGKKKHQAKMEEIAAETPDHSPMWPIGLGLGLLAVVGYAVLAPSKPAAVRAA